MSEWIPVKTSADYPKENGLYLITRKANYPQKARDNMYRQVTYAYYNTLFKRWRANGYADVIAWMPLPEPYRPEEDKNVQM